MIFLKNTVQSRSNEFQGTRENYPLLPKSVIAKMTTVNYFFRKKKKFPSFLIDSAIVMNKSSKIMLLNFLCALLGKSLNIDFTLFFVQNIDNHSITAHVHEMALFLKNGD